MVKVYRCFFKNCIKPIPPPPPEKRPIEYLLWSDPEAWYGTVFGYGGYNKKLPQDGDDVIIKQHWWMVADTKLPCMGKLLIYGTLELEPHLDFVLCAKYIVIGQGGNLIIGWEDQPMTGSVLISLNGNWDTPDIPIQDGPIIGSKTLGKQRKVAL
ncbi:hypothetical protein OS493_022771 [Desmophyllum pertusum]|uniref:G8 domain-containing protein n=1 Tax=Desmophyllum pertusum TaxID=174260 RepID=A0A9W9YAT3_9CNID|nr:hypothetical protein OS493_022771 [Desmophyllum pertusum]